MTIAEKTERIRQRLRQDHEQPPADPLFEVAQELATEVETRLRGNRVSLAVTTLMDRFGFDSLTQHARRQMDEALRAAGFETTPRLTHVDRTDMVFLSLAAPDDVDDRGAVTVMKLEPAGEPTRFRLGEQVQDDAVLWIDVDLRTADTRWLKQQLRRLEPQPTPEMLADLLQPDKLPKVERYEGEVFGAVSCFAIKAVEHEHQNGKPATKAGKIQLQPVEILASDRWIVSCWHGTNECHDVEEHPTDAVVLNRVDLHRAVSRRWRTDKGLTTPGDVGLAILLELVCDYPEARRIVYSWHESWEMDFHKENGASDADDAIQRQTLVDLRGLVSVLYRSISPLDAATVKAETYWFEGVNTDLAIRLGATLERSLLKLQELSEALRNDFDLIHMRATQQQAERTERLESNLQLLAGALVVPALVLAGFSANEKLIPWYNKAWGFLVILALVVLAAVISFPAFERVVQWRTRKSSRKRRASRASASATPGAAAAGAPRPARRPARAPAPASRGRAA